MQTYNGQRLSSQPTYGVPPLGGASKLVGVKNAAQPFAAVSFKSDDRFVSSKTPTVKFGIHLDEDDPEKTGDFAGGAIGAGLGFAFGGPVGALAGVAVGRVVGKAIGKRNAKLEEKERQGNKDS